MQPERWYGATLPAIALYALIVVGLLLTACDGEHAGVTGPVDGSPASLTILALGDSYTIGEGVTARERWPAQLADSLVAAGVPVSGVTYVAQSGWTTGTLLAAIDTFAVSAGVGKRYDLVSVLIGVNNQFGGFDIADYGPEFDVILQRALAFAGGDTAAVTVLSIPDYGVTPVGSSLGAERIAAEIDAYNAINRGVADDYGVTYVDITPLSREAAGDPTLVARDGLHFSGRMYARWVSLALPAALALRLR